jgi:hypothetical protein
MTAKGLMSSFIEANSECPQSRPIKELDNESIISSYLVSPRVSSTRNVLTYTKIADCKGERYAFRSATH